MSGPVFGAVLSIYLVIGALIALFFVILLLASMDPGWVDAGDEQGPDSVQERRLTRAQVEQILDRVPGRNPGVVLFILVTLAWPYVVVVAVRSGR